MGVKVRTRTLGVLGGIGRFPITVSPHVTLLKYWSCLVQMDNVKLVKKAVNILCQIHHSGFETWYTKVYNLFVTSQSGRAYQSDV